MRCPRRDESPEETGAGEVELVVHRIVTGSSHEMVVLSERAMEETEVLVGLTPLHQARCAGFFCELLTQYFFAGAGKLGYTLATEVHRRPSMQHSTFVRSIRMWHKRSIGSVGSAIRWSSGRLSSLFGKCALSLFHSAHPSLANVLSTISIPLSYSP